MELLTVLMRWNLRIEVSIYFNSKLTEDAPLVSTAG